MITMHVKKYGLMLAALWFVAGCGGTTGSNTPASAPQATSGSNNPAEIAKNIEKNKVSEATAKPAADESKPAAPEVKPEGVVPKDLGAGKQASAAPAPAADGVKLVPANWSEYQKAIVPTGGKKFTLVDAWATWCAPCKANFPHVVEMHEKYAAKGLQVISLSMDDMSDAKAVKEATEFLVSKKAVFTNLLMNEAQDVAFDKLGISAIPSVFLFDAAGKEVKRFTLEDPNNQFTYAQVEATIDALLAGKPLPEFKKEVKPAEKAK